MRSCKTAVCERAWLLFYFLILLLILKLLHFVELATGRKELGSGAVPFEPAAYMARVGSCLTAQRQPQSCLVTFPAVLTRATANPASLLKYGHSFKNTNHNRYNVPRSLHPRSELFQLCFAYKIPAVAWVFQAVLGSRVPRSGSPPLRRAEGTTPKGAGRELLRSPAPKHVCSLPSTTAWSRLWTGTSRHPPLGLTPDVDSWIRSSVNIWRSYGQLQFPWPQNRSLHFTWTFCSQALSFSCIRGDLNTM